MSCGPHRTAGRLGSGGRQPRRNREPDRGLGAISAGCIVWKYFRDVKSARLENSWSYLMTLTDGLSDFDLNGHFIRLGLADVHRPTSLWPAFPLQTLVAADRARRYLDKIAVIFPCWATTSSTW
jgi:hypothetical protein